MAMPLSAQRMPEEASPAGVGQAGQVVEEAGEVRRVGRGLGLEEVVDLVIAKLGVVEAAGELVGDAQGRW